MTLNEMKTHFFNESTELGMASPADIERLCVWLEKNGHDAGLAEIVWESARDEIKYLVAEALAEFC